MSGEAKNRNIHDFYIFTFVHKLISQIHPNPAEHAQSAKNSTGCAASRPHLFSCVSKLVGLNPGVVKEKLVLLHFPLCLVTTLLWKKAQTLENNGKHIHLSSMVRV